MSERVELKARTVAWIAIATSGAVAFALMQSTDTPPIVRLVCAWYALIVACLLFVVIGVTLSAKFGRLDTTEGLLARVFFLGWW